jgi:hypothetical protein
MKLAYERTLWKNALTFSDAVKFVRATFDTFSDHRTGKNTTYSVTDVGLSAFSVFFMQSPSFFDFQRSEVGIGRRTYYKAIEEGRI